MESLAAFDRRGRNMTRHLSALLLLAVFGLGLVVGPHPCSAQHEEQASAPASCHEPEPSGKQIRPETQQDDDDCCSAFCQHACHVTAIAEAVPMAFAISAVSEATVEPSGSGLPLFAHPIDHIPLA
ncbi:MAG TPA: hypothetical protein VF179_17980 [Thermoanaerobaculia bacterium]|nr:hypothetical protein [Thermoanaerobaculia bacterium]